MPLVLADSSLAGSASIEDGSQEAKQVAEPIAHLPLSPVASACENATPTSPNVHHVAPEQPASGLDSHPTELQWTNIDLEVNKAPTSPSGNCVETSSLSSFGMLPGGVEERYGTDEHPLWAWVSGGGCLVDLHSSLKWFSIQSGL